MGVKSFCFWEMNEIGIENENCLYVLDREVEKCESFEYGASFGGYLALTLEQAIELRNSLKTSIETYKMLDSKLYFEWFSDGSGI